MKTQLINFNEGFNDVHNFLTEMRATSSGNDKIAIIKKWKDNEFLKTVFQYTYNDFRKYGVHKDVLIKNPDLVESINNYDLGHLGGNLFGLLDDLNANILTGHDAIKAVNAFIKDLSDEHKNIVYCVLDRDLKMGASARSILKVIPGLIPVFKVALAKPYEPKRVDLENEEWYGSRKLDGVRCICRKEGNSINFYSRSGKEFLTLSNLKSEIQKIGGDFILDGEVCIVDENGKEDFQGIMKQIRKKNHTIESPKFLVFDYLSLQEFDTQGKIGATKKLKERYDEAKQKIEPASNLVTVIQQTKLNTQDEFTEMVKDADQEGYEGIMVRKNITYEGKRSHNLLKVKKFIDDEYSVLGTENNLMRWTEDGKQVEKECLSNIIVEHKGNRVSVGSGFSKEQREYYFKNPDEIIGKTVTIQYFEESENQNGTYSLRFPVIKHIYEDGRTV